MRRVLRKSGQLGKTNRDAVLRVYDEADNVIETHKHTGDFQTVVRIYSHHVAFPAKPNFYGSAFVE